MNRKLIVTTLAAVLLLACGKKTEGEAVPVASASTAPTEVAPVPTSTEIATPEEYYAAAADAVPPGQEEAALDEVAKEIESE